MQEYISDPQFPAIKPPVTKVMSADWSPKSLIESSSRDLKPGRKRPITAIAHSTSRKNQSRKIDDNQLRRILGLHKEPVLWQHLSHSTAQPPWRLRDGPIIIRRSGNRLSDAILQWFLRSNSNDSLEVNLSRSFIQLNTNQGKLTQR